MLYFSQNLGEIPPFLKTDLWGKVKDSFCYLFCQPSFLLLGPYLV